MAIDERSFRSEIDHAIADGDETVPNVVPNDRLGQDPLLVNPVESTGLTGQIARPGDQTPRWLVPLFTVGCGAFIAVLLLISS